MAESALLKILFYNPNVGPIPLGIPLCIWGVPLIQMDENSRWEMLKFAHYLLHIIKVIKVMKLSLPCPCFSWMPSTNHCCCSVYCSYKCVLSRLVHLILSLSVESLSISYPDLIKFHYFADNSQEGIKHQMRGATQAQQQGMTLQISLIFCVVFYFWPRVPRSLNSGIKKAPPVLTTSPNKEERTKNSCCLLVLPF
jgi:hypothetical protein